MDLSDACACIKCRPPKRRMTKRPAPGPPIVAIADIEEEEHRAGARPFEPLFMLERLPHIRMFSLSVRAPAGSASSPPPRVQPASGRRLARRTARLAPPQAERGRPSTPPQADPALPGRQQRAAAVGLPRRGRFGDAAAGVDAACALHAHGPQPKGAVAQRHKRRARTSVPRRSCGAWRRVGTAPAVTPSPPLRAAQTPTTSSTCAPAIGASGSL